MDNSKRIAELEAERERLTAKLEDRDKFDSTLRYYAGADYLPTGSASQLAYHEVYGKVVARLSEIDSELSQIKNSKHL